MPNFAIDWKQLDYIILEIQNLSDTEAFEDFILNKMPYYLGASFASWNIHDAEMRMTRVNNSADYNERVAQLVPALNQSIHTHPSFKFFFDFETQYVRYVDTVERTRDHCDDDEFYATPFYQNVAKPLEIEDQLILHVCVKDTHGVILTFHSKEKFTEQQLLLASILRGHILGRLYALSKQVDSYQETKLGIIEKLNEILTERETQTLQELCTGKTSIEISDTLDISSRTVDKHVAQILTKLGMSTRNQLIATYAPWLNTRAAPL